ncbi:MAG: HIT family protein [Candidatus Pacebacteria bacterium]|nr:HIT family protein [Candidatus Paceibacterota bacterium]NUQ56988.1 HIT family protein [Candidatus Paceibacter sp.]
MNNCVFCKIINGEIPADKIYEDADFLAFLDINPINSGHALLIPKTHYENLYNIPDKVLSAIAPLIKKLAVAVKQGINADGINIGMNNDSAAGQVVPHAHFHIIPRFSDDGLRHWPGKPYANKEEAAEMVKKIKSGI